MALVRCYLIGRPAPNMVNMKQLDVERLFPFEKKELEVYPELDDAKHMAKLNQTKAPPNSDVPIFVLEIPSNVVAPLLEHDKIKMAIISVKLIKYCNIPPRNINSIDNVLILKADESEAEYRFKKAFYQLGLNEDTKPYDDAWKTTSGQIDAKMKAVLTEYSKGSSFAFGLAHTTLFRHHTKDADKILRLIKERKPLPDIYESVFQEFQLYKDEILDGKYAPALRVLMLYIGEELERIRLETIPAAAIFRAPAAVTFRQPPAAMPPTATPAMIEEPNESGGRRPYGPLNG